MLKHVVIFTFVLTTLFSNQEQKAESFSFMGITASGSDVDFKSTTDIPNNNDALIGFRYGQQTVDWRTMFTVSGNMDTQEFTLEIDKILMDDIFGYPEIRPYAGITAGYLHYEDNAVTEENGYYFGGAFGFLIYLTDNLDLDISYHYKKVKDITPLNNMSGPTIGIHYFY